MASLICTDDLKCCNPQIDRPHTGINRGMATTRLIDMGVDRFTEALDVALEFAEQVAG